MPIEEIVAKLQEQGLEKEAIVASLKEMLEKGEISEEDLAKAMQMLEGAVSEEEEEKEVAKKLYGDDLFD